MVARLDHRAQLVQLAHQGRWDLPGLRVILVFPDPRARLDQQVRREKRALMEQLGRPGRKGRRAYLDHPVLRAPSVPRARRVRKGRSAQMAQ